MILIELDGEKQLVHDDEADAKGKLPNYPGATILARDVEEPNELAELADDGKSFAIPTEKAEAVARERVEKAADELVEQTVPAARRLAILQMWNEVQLVKLLVATGQVPDDPTERTRRVPFLGALALQLGVPLEEVWLPTQNRLEERVWTMANAEVSTVLAQEQIKAAPTPEAMLDVVDNVDWKPA